MASTARLWDISPPVDARSPVFPGDTPYQQHWVATLGPGCPVNVSAITLSPHVGAHADAPLHYDAEGAAVGTLALEPFLGRCRVIHAIGCGPLVRWQHLAHALHDLPPRVLVRTCARAPLERFDDALTAYAADTVEQLADRGVQGYQCYVTADVGLIAYETSARSGLVLDEGVILEIVRPGTGDPVPEGEVGEVVITVLQADYPMVRFGTGDLSAVLAGACPTGRSNTRIKGWLGRADQTAKVRGMFVHPSQVAEVARRHPEVQRARLVVAGEMANDTMTLHVEVPGAPDGLAARLADSVRDVTKLRADIVLCAPGSLPNDGKVIEDARSYK